MNKIVKRSYLALVLPVSLNAREVGAAEPDQIKSDLVGRTMGGREKCWKFQSREQIKDLVITEAKEDAQKRVYILKLQLEADKTCGRFAAEVRVEYSKDG